MLRYWLYVSLALSLGLAVAHHEALAHYWYWKYPWSDVPVHFLAGLVMGTAVVGVLGTKRPRVFLVSVVIGAVGWEVFEYALNLNQEANYILDTSLDLLMDSFGAIAAYVFARLSVWR